MEAFELSVTSKEQKVNLSNGYVADLRFDPIYRRWYCNIIDGDTIIYAGVPLNVDSFPLHQISKVYVAILDRLDNLEDYEPYLELGNRLALVEVNE